VNLETLFPHTVFHVLGVPIRDTVLQGTLIVLALGLFAVITHNKYRVWEPRKWQIVVEYLVEYIEGIVRDMSGRSLPQVVPLLTTMILFIAIGNLLGLLPTLQAPTRDLNTTAAMSAVALGSWLYFGIDARGLKGYLRSFIEPVPLMLPLNLLSVVSRMLSMALRLFGNVLANEIVVGVMFMLVPALAPLPMTLLGIITGVLQALVFTYLTCVFIVDAAGLEQQDATTLEQEPGGAS